MYAIVETGGKQYRVAVGDRIDVEKLEAEPGAQVELERVLFIHGDGETKIGNPVVDGAKVTARVEKQFRGEKIRVFKYKPKKRYRRRMGHRQSLTKLVIEKIEG